MENKGKCPKHIRAPLSDREGSGTLHCCAEDRRVHCIARMSSWAYSGRVEGMISQAPAWAWSGSAVILQYRYCSCKKERVSTYREN